MIVEKVVESLPWPFPSEVFHQSPRNLGDWGKKEPEGGGISEVWWSREVQPRIHLLPSFLGSHAECLLIVQTRKG